MSPGVLHPNTEFSVAQDRHGSVGMHPEEDGPPKMTQGMETSPMRTG